jgi:hypothetical protein
MQTSEISGVKNFGITDSEKIEQISRLLSSEEMTEKGKLMAVACVLYPEAFFEERAVAKKAHGREIPVLSIIQHFVPLLRTR